LELAEKIATAVIRATQPDGSKPYGDAPVQAVIRTLHEHHSWFCRITLTEKRVNGLALFGDEFNHEDTIEEPYEQVEEPCPPAPRKKSKSTPTPKAEPAAAAATPESRGPKS